MWYKMAEVTSAYKHIRYEQIWYEGSCVMPNVKVFAMQDGQPVDQLAG